MKRMSLGFAALLLAIYPALAQQSPPATSADIATQTKTQHNDAYAYSRDVIAAQKAGDAATGAKLDLLHSDLQALIAQLKAGATVSPAASATASTGSTPAAAVNYFPADATQAPFPSPENSSIIRLGDKIGGAAYLRDQIGAIHQLVPVDAKTANAGYLVNGVAPNNGNIGPFYVQLLLRSGDVYAQISTGQWAKFEPSAGGLRAATPPDIVTAASAAAAAAPFALPVLPNRYSPAPGTSGRVLAVCATCTYTTVTAAITAAADGDTVDITGSYREGIPAIEKSLLLRSTTKAKLDFTGVQLAGGGLGGIVPRRDIIVDGLELTGAGMAETSAGGTGCIRTGAAVYVTVRNSYIHDCQDGISGGFASVFDVSDTVLDHNGLGDGYTHNTYFFDGVLQVTLTRVTSTNARAGHEIKSRAFVTTIKDSKFVGAAAGANNDDASVLDFPNGGLVTITNSTVTKQAGAMNHLLIGYALENSNNKLAPFTMTGGALIGLCDSPLVAGRGGSTMTFSGVANDNKVKVSGATAVGL